MKFEKENYSKLKDDIINISSTYNEKEDIDRFGQHIAQKINDFNPTLMIYGVYNAGKSTLLNALFGVREKAKTGDAPETAEVSAYTYNGYTIYDTPGINAPIKHQNVTDEQLSKSEVVLFVLSNNGSFEDEYVYKKIGEIIKAKKPIVVVMNNKSGIDMNSTDAINEINKVNINISTIGDRMGIKNAERGVNVVFVDALTALEGKTNKEQELIDESKIVELESQIDSLLGDSGISEVSNALNLYISSYIENTMENIDAQIDSPEMQKTQELITYLEKMKQKTFSELKDLAVQSVTIATQNMLELVLSKDRSKIEEMVNKTTQEINDKLNSKISEIQSELKEKIDKFKVEFEKVNINNPNVNLEFDNSSELATKEDTSSSGGGTNMTSIATSIAPFVPHPVGKGLIMLAGVLLDLFMGSNDSKAKASAQLDEKRSQHLAAKNRADEFGMKYKEQAMESVKRNMDSVFVGLIQNFKEFADKLQSDNKKLLEDKKRLQGILAGLK